MIHKIIIADRAFNIIEEIHNKAGNLSWEWNRIGGCGAFSFTVPTRFCREISLGGNFNVVIKRLNPSSGDYDTWYQGRIENKIHNLKGGNDESITVKGQGYLTELSDIYVDRDYTSKEVSVIVKDILDNDIVPNSNITYDGGDIVATGFTIDSLEVRLVNF